MKLSMLTVIPCSKIEETAQDLTDELKDAPHTAKVFERLKVIGKLSAGH